MKSITLNDMNDAVRMFRILINNNYICFIHNKIEYYKNGNGVYRNIFIIDYEKVWIWQKKVIGFDP